MRRVLVAAVLVLAPACNQLFGLDAPADDDIDDDAGGDATVLDSADLTDGRPPGCGDDTHDPENEQCDDGNDIPWDGCNNDCKLELEVGCADGTREGFGTNYEFIAACAGAFSNPGLTAFRSNQLDCIDTGDDGIPPAGGSCSAENLCAAGWHICAGAQEVLLKTTDRGCGTPEQAFAPGFFATNQQSDGLARCLNSGGANDIFGCGDTGLPAGENCAPLTVYSGDVCIALTGGWMCPTPDNERTTVIKPSIPGGGVLCCR
jgi:cysteine-rich repeat protein